MAFPSCGWVVRVIYELGAVTLLLFLTPWKQREPYGIWESGLMEPAAPVFPILSTLRMATLQALPASGNHDHKDIEPIHQNFCFKFQESKLHTKAAYEGESM